MREEFRASFNALGRKASTMGKSLVFSIHHELVKLVALTAFLFIRRSKQERTIKNNNGVTRSQQDQSTHEKEHCK
jgi:hypothetical protein